MQTVPGNNRDAGTPGRRDRRQATGDRGQGTGEQGNRGTGEQGRSFGSIFPPVVLGGRTPEGPAMSVGMARRLGLLRGRLEDIEAAASARR